MSTSDITSLGTKCTRSDTSSTCSSSHHLHLVKDDIAVPVKPVGDSLDEASYEFLKESLLDTIDELFGAPLLDSIPHHVGVDLAGSGSVSEGVMVIHSPLSKEERMVVDQVYEWIKDFWLMRASDTETRDKLLYSFADPLAFWHSFGEQQFRDFVAFYENKQNLHMKDVALNFLNKIQRSVCKDPFQSKILHDIYSSIFDRLLSDQQKKRVSEELNHVIEESKKVGVEMRSIYDAGVHCAKTAIWIGFQRHSDIDPFWHKHLVETDTLYQMGIKSKAFSANDAVLLDLNEWDRVCAPTKEADGSYKKQTIIFWEKASASDCNPSWDKVFGAVVHNRDALYSHFSPEKSEMVTTQMKAAIQFVYNSQQTSCERHFPQGGGMVKGQGLQSVFGSVY
ncbi:hypothetical protein JAAARDRAFT_51760 [Jaapia argillacea MUCL 33604]|uniref:Uncharacterized protein n=1 Tax=Jaapia argillacea MUCL 33604 TaxID=933084 RepID=A0A067P3H1_9AGAM|nr:hypothetical protein JAAARDRAFT_51760 [Jaapia argillacea MUCL 33604]